MKRNLLSAEKQLTAGKIKEADEVLQYLQENAVTILSSSAERPLAEASENLDLARIEIRDGKHKQALQTLKVASSQLKEYEKLSSKARAKEVRTLHQEIDKLTKELDDENDLKAALKSSEKKFGEWWQRSRKWYKK